MKTINQTAKTKPLAESLRPVFEGFRRISKVERIAYLKYLNLVIERQTGKREKKTLSRFKAKLENYANKNL